MPKTNTVTFREVSVREALEMDEGDAIELIKGTLSKLYPRIRSGTSPNGIKWKFQDGELAEGGKAIKVTFANCEDDIPQTWIGKEVVFESTKNVHGLTGVKIKVNEYPAGVFSNVLHVTPTSVVTCEEAENDGEDEGGDGDVAPQHKGQFKGTYGGNDEGKEPAPNATPAKDIPAKEIPGKDQRMKEQAKLQSDKITMLWRAEYKIIKQGAAARAELEKEGVVIPDEHFQSACASVFIALDKCGMT